MSTRKLVSIISIMVLALLATGCDSSAQSGFIFQNPEGTVTVEKANPIPENVGSDGFTFIVSFDLPYIPDGYDIVILPSEFSCTEQPESTIHSWGWCRSPSDPSLSQGTLNRGGWLCYRDQDNNVDLSSGVVETWSLFVKKKTNAVPDDYDSYKRIYQAEFPYKVEIKK